MSAIEPFIPSLSSIDLITEPFHAEEDSPSFHSGSLESDPVPPSQKIWIDLRGPPEPVHK